MKNKSNHIINKILFCAFTAGVSFAPRHNAQDALFMHFIARMANTICGDCVNLPSAPSAEVATPVPPVAVPAIAPVHAPAFTAEFAAPVPKDAVPAIVLGNSAETIASTGPSSRDILSPRDMFIDRIQRRIPDPITPRSADTKCRLNTTGSITEKANRYLENKKTAAEEA